MQKKIKSIFTLYFFDFLSCRLFVKTTIFMLLSGKSTAENNEVKVDVGRENC